MKFIKSIFIAALLFVINYSASGQNTREEGKLTRTVYCYQFEGAKSLAEVDKLNTDILALKGVTEFKSVFKSENKLAQILVVVTERTRVSESDILFEITDLKKILESKDYKNLELSYEEIAVE